MIGLFDSGSGGLTILEALHRDMPDQDFLYLGDHRNAPYGHRSNSQILELTKAGVDRLMEAGCELVILACNTAAAVALRSLQQDWLPHVWPERRVLGVLVPMVEAITGVPWCQTNSSLTLPPPLSRKPQHIALFATRKTIDSKAYQEEVAKRAPHVKLYPKACPGLVDAIEGGGGPKPLAGLVSGYVSELMEQLAADGLDAPDAVLLGCTHFPLVKSDFQAALPASATLYDQGTVVSASTADYLRRHPRFRVQGSGTVILWTTGETPLNAAQENNMGRNRKDLGGNLPLQLPLSLAHDLTGRAGFLPCPALSKLQSAPSTA